jgi:hypothetical protein
MDEQRPLVLVDIDGCANVLAWPLYRDGERVAPPPLRRTWAAGYELHLHPEHGAWFAEVEAAGAELRWSSMWQAASVEDFAPEAGYGEDWPWLDFDAHHGSGLGRMRGLGGADYKMPAWQAVAEQRPLVIIDDDFTADSHAWAWERDDSGLPTLLVQPDCEVGIERWHIDEVLAFLSEIA